MLTAEAGIAISEFGFCEVMVNVGDEKNAEPTKLKMIHIDCVDIFTKLTSRVHLTFRAR